MLAVAAVAAVAPGRLDLIRRRLLGRRCSVVRSVALAASESGIDLFLTSRGKSPSLVRGNEGGADERASERARRTRSVRPSVREGERAELTYLKLSLSLSLSLPRSSLSPLLEVATRDGSAAPEEEEDGREKREQLGCTDRERMNFLSETLFQPCCPLRSFMSRLIKVGSLSMTTETGDNSYIVCSQIHERE